MKILVTGGGGFLGRYICRDLKEIGHDVVSFSRNKHKLLDDLNVKQVQGSLDEINSLRRAFEGIEAVFHVASKAGFWGDYHSYYQTNVIGSKNIIKLCREFNIKYCIYTSTPSVVHKDGGIEGIDESIDYPEKFKAPYPQTKAIAEKMFIDANSDTLKTICLRPHLIWGPEDHHFLPRLKQRSKSGKLMLLGTGEYLVDHIYVENASFAHIKAFEALVKEVHKADGRAYFISQNQPITIKQLINNLLQAIGEPHVKKFIPAWLGILIGKILENIFQVVMPTKEPLITSFVAAQLSTPHWFDCRASKKFLGYEPKIDTLEGLNRLRKWASKQC